MSIASQISALQGLRTRLVNKLAALGIINSSGSRTPTITQITEAVEGMGGTKSITDTSQVDVAKYQHAQVVDPNLLPANIAQNVTILGVTGTLGGTPQQMNLISPAPYEYGTSSEPPLVFLPPHGYDGFANFSMKLAESGLTLVKENIKSGVTIMGVTGNAQLKTTTYHYERLVTTTFNSGSVSVSMSFGFTHGNNNVDLVSIYADTGYDENADSNRFSSFAMVYAGVSGVYKNRIKARRYYNGECHVVYFDYTWSVTNGTSGTITIDCLGSDGVQYDTNRFCETYFVSFVTER